MDNLQFSQRLEQRTKEFAISIIKFASKLPNFSESLILRKQLTRSGTSIGANYREANRSRSKAEFISKIRICQAESSETVYWLELINELEWTTSSDVNFLHKEAKEILAIFTSIVTKLNQKK